VKSALMDAPGEIIAKQIIPNDKWNPLGFVDAIESASRRDDPAYDKLLRNPSRRNPLLFGGFGSRLIRFCEENFRAAFQVIKRSQFFPVAIEHHHGGIFLRF
jgi:hypothetical protein